MKRVNGGQIVFSGTGAATYALTGPAAGHPRGSASHSTSEWAKIAADARAAGAHGGPPSGVTRYDVTGLAAHRATGNGLRWYHACFALAAMACGTGSTAGVANDASANPDAADAGGSGGDASAGTVGDDASNQPDTKPAETPVEVPVTPEGAPPTDALELTSVLIGAVPCDTNAGEFPSNIARYPGGGIVGTCNTFSGTSAKLWRLFPPDNVVRIIGSNLPYGVDEVLVNPQPPHQVFATYHDGSTEGWLQVDPLDASAVPTLSPWAGATYVKGLAFAPESLLPAHPALLAVGASMLNFETGVNQPGRLATFAVDDMQATPHCELDDSQGKNLTSLGYGLLNELEFWIGVNSEPFNPKTLAPADTGSLIFVGLDCQVLRQATVPGSLGIAGKLSTVPGIAKMTVAPGTRPAPDGSELEALQIALPSARAEAGFYLATVTAPVPGTDDAQATDLQAADINVALVPVPESVPSTEHFINSVEFGPLGTALFACDFNQMRCWWFARQPEENPVPGTETGAPEWPVEQEYPLTGSPGNVVWGPEGVWYTNGTELRLVPTAQ